MQKDLGMNDVMWSTSISMFYVGYIISQVPANVIIAKGNSSHPHALLYARLVRCHNLYACDEE